ncbi:MAG: protein TolR [Pseudomonadota bacterium]
MAISKNGSNGRGSRRKRRHQPMSEINVTPFVDVMLVLLIIFMVTAPLLTVGVPLDMPKTNAGAVNADTKPLTISVDNEGRIFLQESEIEPDEIVAKLRAISENRTGEETRIFVRGDKAVAYDVIARVLADISSAGFKKITLSSLPQDGQ